MWKTPEQLYSLAALSCLSCPGKIVVEMIETRQNPCLQAAELFGVFDCCGFPDVSENGEMQLQEALL